MRVARVWRLAVAASAATVVTACGGGSDGGPGPVTAVFTTLAVTPSPATVFVGFTQPLTAIAKSQTNANLSGLNASYTSSDPTRATVTSAGVVTGVAVGTARITVTGTIGSVTKAADVNVTVTAPSSTASVAATLDNRFEPATAAVTRGGSVTWSFATVHNVTFSGSAAPANIPDKASGTESRAFPNAGTFNYTCTIHPGMNGSVVVP